MADMTAVMAPPIAENTEPYKAQVKSHTRRQTKGKRTIQAVVV